MAHKRSHLSTRFVRAAQIGVMIGVVLLLGLSVDWRASIELLAAADLRWVGAAIAVLTLQTLLSALRWRIAAAQLGISIAPGLAIREYYLSQAVNQSLPGGVVGDANRALRARSQAGLLASGQAVVFERVAGQLGLLMVLFIGLTGTLVLPTAIEWPLWLLAPVVLGIAAVLLLPPGVMLLLRLSGFPDTALHRTARRFAHALAARDVILPQSMLSLATATCNVAAFAFCATALGVFLPVSVHIVLVPLILFAMVLPLSISGWGLREGAAAALFPLAGATSAEGLATSVAFGVVFLAAVLPGVTISWLRPNAPVRAEPSAMFEGSRTGLHRP